MQAQRSKEISVGKKPAIARPLLFVDTASLYLWLRVNAPRRQIDYRKLAENLANGLNSESLRITNWIEKQAWITRKGNYQNFQHMLEGFDFKVQVRDAMSMDVELAVSLIQQFFIYGSLVLVTANPNLHIAMRALSERKNPSSLLWVVSFPSVLEQPMWEGVDCDTLAIEKEWLWS